MPHTKLPRRELPAPSQENRQRIVDRSVLHLAGRMRDLDERRGRFKRGDGSNFGAQPMRPTDPWHYARQSDPVLNRNFSRRWCKADPLPDPEPRIVAWHAPDLVSVLPDAGDVFRSVAS